MAKFEFPVSSNGSPVSLFARTLNGRKISISHKPDTMHPCRAIALGATKLELSLSEFSRELDSVDAQLFDTSDVERRLVRAFEDLCYCVTELFDVYAFLIPSAINFRPSSKYKIAEQEYNNTIKKRRRDWSLVCNKIKHNHNVIVPVKQKSRETGDIVYGYTLCQPTHPDGLQINPEFHKAGERSRPFDISIRQMLHDLFRADLAASEMVHLLPQDTEQTLEVGEVIFHIGASLKSLASRKVLAGDQQANVFDGFELSGDAVVFRRQTAERLRGQKEISSIFRADGFTKSFEMI